MLRQRLPSGSMHVIKGSQEGCHTPPRLRSWCKCLLQAAAQACGPSSCAALSLSSGSGVDNTAASKRGATARGLWLTACELHAQGLCIGITVTVCCLAATLRCCAPGCQTAALSALSADRSAGPSGGGRGFCRALFAEACAAVP